MDPRAMPADQVGAFQSAARKASDASDAIQSAILALLPFAEPGSKAAEAVALLTRAEDATRGLGYRLTPQSEWTGGDSLDASNFRYRWPHL